MGRLALYYQPLKKQASIIRCLRYLFGTFADNQIKNESLTPALSKGEGVWFTLDGKKLDKPQKGINIIRNPDGTSKKVLVK